MAKILVIEDDQSLREALTYNLRVEEFTPLVASDAVSAVELARREKPDLILLDLMLPGGSGFEVCKSIRSFSSAPIIILTARSDDIDRVLGLEIGADDYVTKPFSIRELFARIRANLRRIELDKGTRDDPFLKHGNVHIDVPARQVRVGDAAVTLQPKEFDLLVYLLRHPRTVLTRERLLHAVWGHDFVGVRTVDVHVRRVRAKLQAARAENVIRTVHGVGYGLDAEAADDVSLAEQRPS